MIQTFATLSSLAGAAHARALADPRYRALPRREGAALLAHATFGSVVGAAAEARDPGAAALINVAALALGAGDRLPLYVIRPGAVRLVHETDLHALPAEPPRLLRGAWVCEVRRPEAGERLWSGDAAVSGDTVALAGYPLDGRIHLVGLGYPDGVAAARWEPRWTGEDLEATVPLDEGAMLGADLGAGDLADWTRQAARFAVVLALLLEASDVPLRIETEERGRRARKRKTPAAAPGLATRHLYLDEDALRRAQADAGGAGAEAAATAPEGRTAASVPVRGHLRRQRHGPGRTKTKWVYVASYQARRWVAPGPVRTVIHRRRGE